MSNLNLHFTKTLPLSLIAGMLMSTVALADGATLTGDIMYRERMALPANAQAIVSLVDISRADAPSITLAQELIAPLKGSPIPFVLDFDTAVIQKGHTYALQARIEVDEKLWFINDTAILVEPLTQTGMITIPVIRTGGDAQVQQLPEESNNAKLDLKPLFDTKWMLAEIKGEPVAKDVESTLNIGDEGQVGGVGGCNTYGGQVSLTEENTLSFGNLFSTMMACSEPKMQQEGAFLSALSEVTGFNISDETLNLLSSENSVILSMTKK